MLTTDSKFKEVTAVNTDKLKEKAYKGYIIAYFTDEGIITECVIPPKVLLKSISGGTLFEIFHTKFIMRNVDEIFLNMLGRR